MKTQLFQLLRHAVKLRRFVMNDVGIIIASLRHGQHRLRRRGKHLITAQTVSNFSVTSEIDNLLQTITTTFDTHGIDYFVMSGEQSIIHQIGVMDTDRQKVIKVLQTAYADTPLFALVQRKKVSDNIPYLFSKLQATPSFDTPVTSIQLHRYLQRSRHGRIVAGAEIGCRLDFWTNGATLEKAEAKRSIKEFGIENAEVLTDALIATVPNDVTPYIKGDDGAPAKKTIRGTSYKTRAIFNKTPIGETDFPIDIVYTWVDDSDPAWQKKYAQAKGIDDTNAWNNAKGRYTNHDELKYSLRSLAMYAPFVRNVYIVTDNQVPEWLNQDAAGLKVVDHSQIFSDPSVLPVFNSHAIESQLHHINGLSEHFLYLNDDIFIAQPVAAKTFFFPNGIARVLPSTAMVGAGPVTAKESAPGSASKNAREIVEAEFGRLITNKYRHTPYPQNVLVSKEIEQKYPDYVARTMTSKFRSITDIPFTSGLQQSYLMASGNGIAAPYSSRTVDVSNSDAAQQMQKVLGGDSGITFCLNESNEVTKETDDQIKSFLASYFPYPSPWERHKDS